MCMAIYISTDKPIPTIPYDEKNRMLNTEDVTDSEETFKNIFSKWMSEDDFKIYQIIIDGYDENQTNNKMFLVVNKIYKYLLKK